MDLETRYATLSYNTDYNLSTGLSTFSPSPVWSNLYQIKHTKKKTYQLAHGKLNDVYYAPSEYFMYTKSIYVHENQFT